MPTQSDISPDKLVLIDGHAMLYRAFYAFPPTLTTRSGTLVNAVYGFTRILLNLIGELSPKYLAASFDIGKTFRHQQYPEYKAHREKMPDELKAQEKIVYRVVSTLNIPVHTKDGFEADDVIGTLATRASQNKVESIIVTGDMDALQLVNQDTIKVYVPGRGQKPTQIFDSQAVRQKYHLLPHQIIDYKALAGDSSDNIPGVRGIGPKTATKLLQVFPDIESIYDYFTDISNNIIQPDPDKEIVLTKSTRQKLLDQKQSAFDSKDLATIRTDVPLKFDLQSCLMTDYDPDKVKTLFEELEFRTLLRQLPKSSNPPTQTPAKQQALF